MKIVTFFLACVAWMKCTTSAPSRADVEYDESMRTSLIEKSRNLASARPGWSFVTVSIEDVITIHKVIDGLFVPYDIVYGTLKGTPKVNYKHILNGPPRIDGQYGDLQITLGPNWNFMYHTPLTRKQGYKNHKHTGREIYFCTVQTEQFVHAVGVLRPTGHPRVPDEVPRVVFADHLFVHPRDLGFTGQLFEANPPNVQMLLDSLRT